jgi:predicted DNA-binding transcriptional regulator YafY
MVLLAIADHQGETGAYPSVARLAAMVNASERSVQRDIQYLVDIVLGFVAVFGV